MACLPATVVDNNRSCIEMAASIMMPFAMMPLQSQKAGRIGLKSGTEKQLWKPKYC